MLEVLLAYMGQLREHALEKFRFESLMWVVSTVRPLAKGKSHPRPPKRPSILE